MEEGKSNYSGKYKQEEIDLRRVSVLKEGMPSVTVNVVLGNISDIPLLLLADKKLNDAIISMMSTTAKAIHEVIKLRISNL